MSAKVDGTLKTYKVLAYAIKLQQDTIYTIDFNASAAQASAERLFLVIGIANHPITTGTYLDEGPLNNSQIVAGGYNPGTTDDTKVYGAGLQEDTNPRLTITISSLTDKILTGTFSGTYYDNGGDGPGTIAVTEGKFNLPVTQ